MSEFTNVPNPILSGSLEAFMGTPAEQIVVDSLLELGLNPAMYNPVVANHAQYSGLPAERDPHDDFTKDSPVYRTLVDMLGIGTLVKTPVEHSQIRFRREPFMSRDQSVDFTYATSRLATFGVREVTDPQTGDVVCYLAPLDGAGEGRRSVMLPPALVERTDTAA